MKRVFIILLTIFAALSPAFAADDATPYRPQISDAPMANSELDALRARLTECNRHMVDAFALAYQPGFETCAETQSQWDQLMEKEKQRLRARGRQIRQEMTAPKGASR
jgi:hypothetical protein